jgi:tRNA dimethylallyltransferase
MNELLRGIDAERPVLIAGPTASGKSALAMEIATSRGGLIVNADAMQVFSCWRVLTARPSVADESAVGHRLYGHVGGADAYSVGAWLRDVTPLLDGSRPIIVGGTGLYLTRLTSGLADIPPIPAAVRAEAASRSAASLLAEIDADTLTRIDTANPARVRRAWEVGRATGRGLASWQDDTPSPLLPVERTQAFVVETDRDMLHERIVRRADLMLAGGAVDEVRAALQEFGPGSPAMKAIGAPEIAAHINDHSPLDDTRDRLVTATRQYAKRQRTWFRSNMRSWTAIATA